MMEINGIAHAMLTVSNFEACAPFYRELLGYMGLKPVIDADGALYCVGGRTAVGIMRAEEKFASERFEQFRVGLHHLCFRVRAREDIDELYAFVQGIGAKIVHPPEEGAFAPGYYSVLFEDPDGIRLEANFVPGRGLLEKDAK
jgi:catechol 2,3-dioxygenase-like lactoylglutathione lyase family enzyme